MTSSYKNIPTLFGQKLSKCKLLKKEEKKKLFDHIARLSFSTTPIWSILSVLNEALITRFCLIIRRNYENITSNPMFPHITFVPIEKHLVSLLLVLYFKFLLLLGKVSLGLLKINL